MLVSIIVCGTSSSPYNMKWAQKAVSVIIWDSPMLKKKRMVRTGLNHDSNWSYHIYPTPPLGQDMTQGQFFKRSLTGLNSEFSFS